MIVKTRPINGTTMHVWDKKKYYPGSVHSVDDELGAVLIRKGIAEKVEGAQIDAPARQAATVAPKPNVFRRGPGRPRKNPIG